ncbi:transketolase [Thiotrichales bacterium 19S9-12]|nr:transketolase [Thiotrichales bacterium 19S9-11]MCF6811731.1 transketolase [Thiotrichales bacterium 19S9-12]
MSISRKQIANAIRMLSADAVQKAKSGHPGMPMGMADIAEVLWRDYLNINPSNPNWANRDRFVLSNGHGSMLLYSLLHLSGFDLSIDEIKNFRQMDSKTPGHPEYGYTEGVETTTGPLGQGLANAVGMAIAEKALASRFNKPNLDLIDHYTYVFMGDGCLMEGISHEVCSLAGTLGLGKLITFWDDNGISIDGEVEGWFTENVPERFKAYGWQVITDVDGHNAEAIKKAIDQARSETSKPTIICTRTTIGYGSPNKAGKESCHGAPLGDDEIELVRKELDWNYPPFEIPKEIYQAWSLKDKGREKEAEWETLRKQYLSQYAKETAEFDRLTASKFHQLPENWDSFCNDWLNDIVKDDKTIATRKASQIALDYLGEALPELLGGSADLTGSNLTNHKASKVITHDDFSGNYISYGVREFGMSAIMNGIILHGGFRPYGGTFMVFTDYARNAIRMSALMKQPVIYVMTHDSIGLGEDGPTHQPVEQLASLRVIPNLNVWRPCDIFETQVAWQCAVEDKNTPSILSLSRHNLPQLIEDAAYAEKVRKGGYILSESASPDVVLAATGSEVTLVVDAAKALAEKGINVRVVSVPCMDIFRQQSKDYQDEVIPKGIPAVAVEAGVKESWYGLLGIDHEVISIDSFGESAPASKLFEHFGFTVNSIVEKANVVINRSNKHSQSVNA